MDCAVNNFNKEETEIHKNNKDELAENTLHFYTKTQSFNLLISYPLIWSATNATDAVPVSTYVPCNVLI